MQCIDCISANLQVTCCQWKIFGFVFAEEDSKTSQNVRNK